MTTRLRRAAFLASAVSGFLLLGGALAFAAPRNASDERIADAIGNRLFTDPYFQPKSVRVRSDHGVVTLSGIVRTLRGRARAVRIAEGIKGVSSVIDRVVVSTVEKPDDRLKEDVKTALELDSATSGEPIEASAHRGVVTLTGTVASGAEKTLAGWVVSGLAGVQELENQIEIEPTVKRLDSEIASDIQGRILQDPWVNSASLRVSVARGVVALSGTVASAAAKGRALADSWVRGVKDVEGDQLAVNAGGYRPLMQAGRRPPTDAELRREVVDSFELDPRMKRLRPDVNVSNGIVTLSGGVASVIAQKAAAQDASDTVGVRGVSNLTWVAPQRRRNDDEIVEDIRKVLSLNDPSIVHDVGVSVRKGRVLLSGKVTTPYEKWSAWDAAARVDGVVSIRDDVAVIQKLARMPDELIRKRASEALASDPFIDPSDRVSVLVRGGRAILSGKVNGWADRRSATEDALSAGALAVENRIQVPGVQGG